jgi:hypothetical protein
MSGGALISKSCTSLDSLERQLVTGNLYYNKTRLCLLVPCESVYTFICNVTHQDAACETKYGLSYVYNREGTL